MALSYSGSCKNLGLGVGSCPARVVAVSLFSCQEGGAQNGAETFCATGLHGGMLKAAVIRGMATLVFTVSAI